MAPSRAAARSIVLMSILTEKADDSTDRIRSTPVKRCNASCQRSVYFRLQARHSCPRSCRHNTPKQRMAWTMLITELGDARLAIVGLGYVGLPLAVEFGRRISDGRIRHQSETHCGTPQTSRLDARGQCRRAGRSHPADLLDTAARHCSLQRLHRHSSDADRRIQATRHGGFAIGQYGPSAKSSSAATSSCTNRPSIPAQLKKSVYRSSKRRPDYASTSTFSPATARSGSIPATNCTD